MKVLHFLTTGELGGTERSVMNIAEHLAESGQEVEVAVLQSGGDVERMIKEKNIPCFSAGLPPAAGLVAISAAIRNFFRDKKYDVVTFYGLRLNLAARVFRRGIHAKVHLGGLRSIYPSDSKSNLHLALDRFTFRWTDGYVSNSSTAVDFLVGKGYPRRKFFHVPNGVKIPERSDERCRRRAVFEKYGITVSESDIVIISVANLRTVKNHELMLNAFSRLIREAPMVKLILTGDGPLKNSLSALAERLGVKSRVFFTGRAEDVFPLLQGSDIFLLTSSWEGLPTSVMEASACGVPVVSSNVGGIPEIVKEGRTGLLFEEGSVEDCVEKLKFLVKNPVMREKIGEAGREYMRQEFSFDKMTERYLRLYRKLLENKGSV